MTHAVIIDDDLNNLVILQEMFTRQGISYTAIQNPAQVEAILPQLDQIDVVFLDLQMPGMDGYQIFNMLQTTPKLQRVPVVACTVHTSESNHARDVGFHSFISKPLNVNLFPKQIQDILSGTPVWYVR